MPTGLRGKSIFGVGMIALFLAGSSASAGDLSKRSYSRNFEWESTQCHKPSAPVVFELDQFTRSMIESYLSDVKRYRRCVAEEAETDFAEFQKRMADAIEAGRDEALSDIDSDVDDLTSSIQLAR